MHVESAKKSFSHSKEESEITATLLGNSEAPLFKLAISDFKNPDSSLLFFTISLAMIPTYSSKNSQRLLKKSTRSQIARKSISHFPKKLQLEDMKRRKKRLKTQEIRFIDSFRFMGSLLERLVENLSEEHFIYPKRSFGENGKYFHAKEFTPMTGWILSRNLKLLFPAKMISFLFFMENTFPTKTSVMHSKSGKSLI